MGVCKACRRVTRFFCFNHKRHICEDCIIPAHELCVVKTYRQWMYDDCADDASLKCGLCLKPIGETPDFPVVRLSCVEHVYHQACLADHGSKLPPTTAPAGFACPQCEDQLKNVPIEPAAGSNTSLSNALRTFLTTVSWGSRAQRFQPQQVQHLQVDKHTQARNDVVTTTSAAGASIAKAAAVATSEPTYSSNSTPPSSPPSSSSSVLTTPSEASSTITSRSVGARVPKEDSAMSRRTQLQAEDIETGGGGGGKRSSPPPPQQSVTKQYGGTSSIYSGSRGLPNKRARKKGVSRGRLVLLTVVAFFLLGYSCTAVLALRRL